MHPWKKIIKNVFGSFFHNNNHHHQENRNPDEKVRVRTRVKPHAIFTDTDFIKAKIFVKNRSETTLENLRLVNTINELKIQDEVIGKMEPYERRKVKVRIPNSRIPGKYSVVFQIKQEEKVIVQSIEVEYEVFDAQFKEKILHKMEKCNK